VEESPEDPLIVRLARLIVSLSPADDSRRARKMLDGIKFRAACNLDWPELCPEIQKHLPCIGNSDATYAVLNAETAGDSCFFSTA
jgi:hypothetical protein